MKAAERRQRGLEIAGIAYLDMVQGQPGGLGGRFYMPEPGNVAGIGGIRQHCDPSDAWDQVLQQYDLFTGDIYILARKPGDVPTWMGQIGNDAGVESSSDRTHDDGYRAGGFLGRERGRRPPGDDYVDLERDQLGGQRRITGVVAFGPAIGEPDVLSLAPAELAQALSEAVDRAQRALGENPDPPHLIALLRARREWPQNGRGAEQRDEVSLLHSMTSSACANRMAGTVRPNALAVFRLITSLNFTGCWTGRSQGFVPLRILST